MERAAGEEAAAARPVSADRRASEARSATTSTGFTLFDETDRPDLTATFDVQAIVEDREGRLWFGFSGGLLRFDGRRFVRVGREGPWQ